MRVICEALGDPAHVVGAEGSGAATAATGLRRELCAAHPQVPVVGHHYAPFGLLSSFLRTCEVHRTIHLNQNTLLRQIP